MTNPTSIKIINDYRRLTGRILSNLNASQTTVRYDGKKRSEDFAQDYYESKGYTVYRSRVKKGYRIIGVKYYWKIWEEGITDYDKKIIDTLLKILGERKFKEMAYLVKDKNGCPDLMLIKNDKIQFVEVKTDNEEIKSSTCEWVVRNGRKYPLSIMRIRTK
jgi:hypothetical protein